MSYYIVPNTEAEEKSAKIKESGGSFTCPSQMVMVGRWHKGDENGDTEYMSAPLMVDPNTEKSATVTITDVSDWIEGGKQSNLNYQAPDGYVIVGRKHDGDENGKTYFKIALVRVNNEPAKTVDANTSDSIKESSGTWFETTEIGSMKGVITGMKHSGDENGNTNYYENLVFSNGSSSVSDLSKKPRIRPRR